MWSWQSGKGVISLGIVNSLLVWEQDFHFFSPWQEYNNNSLEKALSVADNQKPPSGEQFSNHHDNSAKDQVCYTPPPLINLMCPF